ncbi:MAG: Nif3-like dinuclear metal center hexameric protein [Bacteroidales bacterium]
MVSADNVIKKLEEVAPLSYQESYDNSGWITGDPDQEVKGVLVALDMTMDVLDEAIKNGENLIITHHPLIFKPLKQLVKGDPVQNMLIKAIKHDIMIYAAHTNLDNAWEGVNRKLANQLGLEKYQILQPRSAILKKLVVFVPENYAEDVRTAIFEAGAGNIGDYDSCSYNLQGKGSFRAGENADPFTGKKQQYHFEAEQRVETIVPEHLLSRVLSAMMQAHPYEEVAYDVYPLENQHERIGAGAIGELPEEMQAETFLMMIKEKLDAKVLRYSGFLSEKIKKIALSGGAGSFLIEEAIRAQADVFVTADLKYHDFQQAEDKILLVDAGHFETEQFTKHLIRDILIENFSTFAVRISQVNTNPVNYF